MNLIGESWAMVYFCLTAWSKNYASLSDRASGCIVVREAILREKIPPKGEVSRFKRIRIAFAFCGIPLALLVSISLIVGIFDEIVRK